MLSNGYNGVLFILSMCCVVSMTASYTLLEENKSVGHSAIAYIGDSYFEILLFTSVGMILFIHMTYLLQSDVTGEE